MNTNRISVRYAKALFSAAQDQNLAVEISNDMKLIETSFQIEDFKLLIENPVIAPSKKIAAFSAIFGKKVSRLTVDFFNLLTKNKREAYLPGITRNFLSIYRKAFSIKALTITTAEHPDSVFVKTIEDILKQKFSTKLETTIEIDEKIVGGFILRMEDDLFDGSVAHKLQQIQKELLEN